MKRIYKVLIGLAMLCMASPLFAGIKGGGVSGQGTAGTIPVWSRTTGLTDSDITESGIIASSKRVSDVVGTTYGEKIYEGEVEFAWIYMLYVDGNTGSDTGLGTSASPFKTINRAFEILPKNVDVDNFYIYIKAGDYSYTPYDDGAGNWRATLVDIEGFYGTGQISISIYNGATLKISGAYDGSITMPSIFSIINCSCHISIYGSYGGTALLSYEVTNVDNNAYHCTAFAVQNSPWIGTSYITIENNNTYADGRTAYTYDYRVNNSSGVTTSGVEYTVGKEGSVTFSNDNTSIIVTDGLLVGATKSLTREYGTNIYIYDEGGYNIYQYVRKGFHLAKTTTTDETRISTETLALLSEYTQTEMDLDDAVDKKHAGGHSGTAGYLAKFTGTNTLGDSTVTETAILTAGFNVVLSDGDSIDTGIKADIVIPYDCTITEVVLLGDVSGDIVIDLWAGDYASFPPTVADTITASAKPTLSTATKSQDTTLTGWTVNLDAGDVLRVHVDSSATVTRVTMFIKVRKR
jgi:hypothetical protein